MLFSLDKTKQLCQILLVPNTDRINRLSLRLWDKMSQVATFVDLIWYLCTALIQTKEVFAICIYSEK